MGLASDALTGIASGAATGADVNDIVQSVSSQAVLNLLPLYSLLEPLVAIGRAVAELLHGPKDPPVCGFLIDPSAESWGAGVSAILFMREQLIHADNPHVATTIPADKSVPAKGFSSLAVSGLFSNGPQVAAFNSFCAGMSKAYRRDGVQGIKQRLASKAQLRKLVRYAALYQLLRGVQLGELLHVGPQGVGPFRRVHADGWYGLDEELPEPAKVLDAETVFAAPVYSPATPSVLPFTPTGPGLMGGAITMLADLQESLQPNSPVIPATSSASSAAGPLAFTGPVSIDDGRDNASTLVWIGAAAVVLLVGFSIG